MIEYERKNLNGVPDYTAAEFEGRRSDYCLLIPVINEGMCTACGLCVSVCPTGALQ